MLHGMQVLDFGRMAAAPYAAMLLADLGADVIKVEPLAGDECRALGPPFVSDDGAQFLTLNRGKRSLALDLRSPAARALVERLVMRSDIVIHNFRADAAQAMGIDYDTLRGLRENLVYCAISGFGIDGPWKSRPGVDLIFQAFTGMMAVTGRPDDPPLRPGVPVADLSTALSSVIGILGAIVHRLRTGEGQKVDVAAIDALMAVQSSVFAFTFATGENPPRLGNASPFAISNALPTADGAIALTVTSDKFWRRLATALNLETELLRPEFDSNTGRLAASETIYAILSARLRNGTTSHWLNVLGSADVPCGPVQTFREALDHAQTHSNGTVVEHLHGSGRRVSSIAAPMKFGRGPIPASRAAPLLGEHSVEVLSELGCTHNEINELLAQGIVVAAPAAHAN